MDRAIGDYLFREESKMSLPEREWQNTGYLLLRDEVPNGVYVIAMGYEWMTFNLPGGHYTPDFFVLFSNGWVFFIEIKEVSTSYDQDGKVKSKFKGKSYRDSRAKLRAAADLNPWFAFYMALYDRRNGTWTLEKIDKDSLGDWVDGTKIGGVNDK